MILASPPAVWMYVPTMLNDSRQTVSYNLSSSAGGSEWPPGPSSSPPASYNWPVLCFFIIVVMAIAGNILVCLAVKMERKLQNMFNYFLVSLALSDMLSAILVMPLSIVKALIGKTLTPGKHSKWRVQLLKLRGCNDVNFPI